MRRLILASASPRRSQLLSEAGISFDVQISGVDESYDSFERPEEVAEGLSLRKARAVAALLQGEDALILAADTVVALSVEGAWRLLGKPAGAVEAEEMLSQLSGSKHAVITGVSVIDAATAAELTSSECTWVTMREITPLEVKGYVSSGEWEDKAGGYAIQESADAFVSSLEGGGFDNVVGLPIGLVRRLLGASGR
jgi:septum formation protein